MFYEIIRNIILKEENVFEYEKNEYAKELYQKMKNVNKITIDMVDNYEHELIENILDYRDHELERVFKIAITMGMEIQKELDDEAN